MSLDVFLHKRGKGEMVITEYPTDPRDGRTLYYINDCLAYLYDHNFPKVVAEKLEKELPMRFAVPAHVGEYVGLWICGFELPRWARRRGAA